MRLWLGRGVLAAMVATGLTHSALAQASAGLSFNLGASTDYAFRGVSQTSGAPELDGGGDLRIGGLGYAGAWLSNVDFGNGTRLEYDLYAGVKPTLGPASLDLGVNRYGYAGSPPGSHQDYVEWKAAASIPAGPAILGAAVYYSDNDFGATGPATYYELNAFSPIPNTRVSLSGAVGRQIVKGPLDYTTWNAGVGYAINDHLGLDLRYWDTDEHAFGAIYGARAVLGLKATF